jgi:hypothetical protein
MRKLSALVLAVLAAAVAGCGAASEPDSSGLPSPQSSESADSAVVLAAARTVSAGSARMAMTMKMEMPGAPGPIRLGAKGEFDFTGNRGRMTLDYSGLLEALGADAEQARGLMPDQMIMDGTVMYMRMPALASVRPGKSWLRLDIVAMAAQQGLDTGALTSQLGQNDPSKFLEYLRGASERVTEIGPDEVRGVQTTHVHAVIDLTRAPDGLTDEQKAQYEQAIAQLSSQSGLTEIPVDVWVDADGLLRRMVMNAGFGAPDGSGPVSMLMTMDLYDFGVVVDVDAPSASKVVDFSEIAALGAS